MVDMAKFDAKAVDYWAGHGRNFLRSMGVRKDQIEQVQPWSERGMQPQLMPGTAVAAPAPVMQLAPSHDPVVGIRQLAPQQTQQGILTRYNGDGTKTLSMNQADGGSGKMTLDASVPTGRGIRRQATQPAVAPAYDFQGSPADEARFMRAPASNSETRGYGSAAGLNPVMQGYTVNDTPAAGGPPKYLGPESGLGWKTRAKLYETEMDAYNKATGLNAALNLEQMRETGAGGRALLAAEGVNAGIRQKGQQFTAEQQRLGLVDQSTQALQAAQAANQTAQAAQGKFIKLKVPDGVDGFGMPKFREVAVDPNKPDTVVDPAGGMREKYVPAMPTDKKQLLVGQAYLLPNGKKATWDGKQFN